MLLAVVSGCGIILLDRHGRSIGKTIQPARLAGPIDRRSALPHLWKLAAARMTAVGQRQQSSRYPNLWLRRAESLAHSFNLRGRDHCRPRARQKFERYPTTDWRMAVKRLWQQGHNSFRHHSRTGWHRWAVTVANNHNKRNGGRYAIASYGDLKKDPKTD